MNISVAHDHLIYKQPEISFAEVGIAAGKRVAQSGGQRGYLVGRDFAGTVRGRTIEQFHALDGALACGLRRCETLLKYGIVQRHHALLDQLQKAINTTLGFRLSTARLTQLFAAAFLVLR